MHVFSPVTSETVFVVSGGARGITARCVVALAQAARCGFILIGRSAAGTGEPEWASGVGDSRELKARCAAALTARGDRATPALIEREVRAVEAHREIAQTIGAIRAAGGRASYLQADLTNASGLRERCAAASAELGPVTGVIHGAGVLADRRIEQKTADDFETVYRAKIDGLLALLDVVDAEALRFLVLFSSAAGFYGNIGQADYAIANEILNKYAHAFRSAHPLCRVVAFDWGPWEGGMVTPALRQLFARRGIATIPLDAGARIFVETLAPSSEATQVVVGSPMLGPGELAPRALRQLHLRRKIRLDINPALADHVIGRHVVLPTAFAIAWMSGAAEQLNPGLRCVRCDDVRVLKGIVFDGSEADEYTCDVEELVRDDAQGLFEARVQIASQDETGRARYHYQSRVVLRREIAPHTALMPRGDARAPAVLDGAGLYRDGTLFHGPLFQSIERVTRIDERGLTMVIRAPQLRPGELGQFATRSIDPLLIDMAVQGMVVWARRMTGAASLPLVVGSVRAFGPTPAGPLFVDIVVTGRDQQRITGTVTVHDAAGVVCSQIVGAEVTLSARLNALFGAHRDEG